VGKQALRDLPTLDATNMEPGKEVHHLKGEL